ncbi:MAG: PhoD-like phosphatase N-terminal domain-containing protein [Oceanococcus sp.]
MKSEKIKTQELVVAVTAARLQVNVPAALRVARSVNWEVFEAGELEPVRYGLCLLDAELGSARINVTGLQPGCAYHYRFACEGMSSPVGAFRTAARLPSRQRAA